jgi:hypothetical protein
MEETIEKQSSSLPPVSNAEAVVRFFREELTAGKHWYLALLESIGRWVDDSEEVDERTLPYLIEGEAFDWLLLAERLCEAVNGLIPENEKLQLLFRGQPPLEISPEVFKTLIGASKHRHYLNYFYGIEVEEALELAVREEVRKERRSSGVNYRQDEENEAYRRIYEATEADLLKEFRQLKGYSQSEIITLNESKEFTYWRFKYRLKMSEKAKVASDTQKGLDWLKQNGCKWKAVKEVQ